MVQMANAAVTQGVDIAREQLREFIVNSDMARQALQVPANQGQETKSTDDISLDTLDSRGKKTANAEEDVDDI